MNVLSKRSLKATLGLCFVVLSFVFCLQLFGGQADMFGNCLLSDNSAKVETWTEQTFWDKFWGNGFFQTRTKYTLNPQKANTSRIYTNRRILVELKNNSSLSQEYSYSKQERIGHQVSASVKAKASHYEAAVEYKFSYEKTTTETVKVNVARYTTLNVYISDVIVKQQFVNVTTQKQVASFTGWKNSGSASYNNEYIAQYDGCSIEYIES